MKNKKEISISFDNPFLLLLVYLFLPLDFFMFLFALIDSATTHRSNYEMISAINKKDGE